MTRPKAQGPNMRKQTPAAIERRQERLRQDARDSALAWYSVITESVEIDIANAVKRGIIKPEEARERAWKLHCDRVDRFLVMIDRLTNK